MGVELMFSAPELDAIISAGAGAIPTTALWAEIRTLLNNVYGAAEGSQQLAGPDGAIVTINDVNTVEYDVFFWIEYAEGVPAGSPGEISIAILSQTSFKIYNSGSDTESILHYRVVPR